jgi:hypothetical protein
MGWPALPRAKRPPHVDEGEEARYAGACGLKLCGDYSPCVVQAQAPMTPLRIFLNQWPVGCRLRTIQLARRRRSQVAKGASLQNWYSWVRIPPPPLLACSRQGRILAFRGHFCGRHTDLAAFSLALRGPSGRVVARRSDNRPTPVHQHNGSEKAREADRGEMAPYRPISWGWAQNVQSHV